MKACSLKLFLASERLATSTNRQTCHLADMKGKNHLNYIEYHLWYGTITLMGVESGFTVLVLFFFAQTSPFASFLGGKLLLWHDEDALQHLPPDFYPETVHHIGLQHRDPQLEASGQDLPRWRPWELFLGWISNGELSFIQFITTLRSGRGVLKELGEGQHARNAFTKDPRLSEQQRLDDNTPWLFWYSSFIEMSRVVFCMFVAQIGPEE